MGSLLVPVFMICTTASLSPQQRTDFILLESGMADCWPEDS